MSKLINLIGKNFGRLKVVARKDNDNSGNPRWLCECSCGNEIIVLGYSIRSGHTKSCGCLKVERLVQRSTSHGHAKDGKKTGSYITWLNMVQRCTNPHNKYWKDYGGRGIIVCKEWLYSFANFLRDNPGWKPGLTIEREDTNGDYCLGNCKWSTWEEQARNRRNNHLIPCFDRMQCIAAWSEETGISQSTIRARIRLGWSPEKAITTPVRKCKKRDR